MTSATDEEHLSTLQTVLDCLQSQGFRLKKSKCSFFMPAVEYLGLVVDAQGLQTTPTKRTAIVEAPIPKGQLKLRSFLGLLNYYAKFIPTLSLLLHPLNQLFRKGEET